MHLLEIASNGDLSLVEFFGSDVPPYAILSHRWGAARDEVSFKDMKEGRAQDKPGFRKLAFCRNKAAEHNLRYFWVDTCCINKTSSAELSEAINSMFAWYSASTVCFVYLEDVSDELGPDSHVLGSVANNISNVWGKENWTRSSWFDRGWTLQELIAPKVVKFYTKSGGGIGTKSDQSERISLTTGIPEHILEGGSLQFCSVAQRMSWAAQRQTTREEDQAYCLLGIFDTNMPLIYGEGKKAFIRLQLAILSQEEDYSILAWSEYLDVDNFSSGILARSPSNFGKRVWKRPQMKDYPLSAWQHTARTGRQGSLSSSTPYYRRVDRIDMNTLQSIVPSKAGLSTQHKLPRCLSIKSPREIVRATSRGLHISLPVKTAATPGAPLLAWIYCLDGGSLICILLEKINNSMVLARNHPSWLVTVDTRFLKDFEMTEVYCQTFGPVSIQQGISGSLTPFQSALMELSERNNQAEPTVVTSRSNTMQALASDLHHVNPKDIVVLSKVNSTYADYVKVWLEDITASSWQWAPLQPPRRQCTDELWHVEWKCLCGKVRWAQASEKFARGLRALISQTTKDQATIQPTSVRLPSFSVPLVLATRKYNIEIVHVAFDLAKTTDLFDAIMAEYCKRRGFLQRVSQLRSLSHFEKVSVRIHSSQQVELLSRSTLINTETVWKLSPELDIWGSILRLVHLRRDLDARAQVQSLLFEHIPERQTPLVEGNSQAESMEAIYACEMVSFRYVLVCLLFGGFVNVGAWTAWKWNYLDDVEDFVSMGWIWTFFVFAVLSLFWLHILANH